MDIREELINRTGLKQEPNESAQKFSFRLLKAMRNKPREGLSQKAQSWLDMGEDLAIGSKHDG